VFVLLVISTLLLWYGSVKKARFFLTSVTLFLIFIAFFPLGKWLLHPLETRFPIMDTLVDKVDGIIVLSGGENNMKTARWGQVNLTGAADRHIEFMKLARHYKNAKLVFTGGSGALVGRKYTGADVAEQLYKEQGLDMAKIVFERRSRNTYENAVFSQKLIHPKPNEKWILITTAWHMPRSVGIFCQLGWQVIPYPVDYATSPSLRFNLKYNLIGNLKEFNIAIKEWIGLLAYYMTGKTDSLFPKGC